VLLRVTRVTGIDRHRQRWFTPNLLIFRHSPVARSFDEGMKNPGEAAARPVFCIYEVVFVVRGKIEAEGDGEAPWLGLQGRQYR